MEGEGAVNEIRGRVLGVDFGRRRIGLALSDALQITARPLGPVDGSEADRAAEEIGALARENEVVEIVVGLPYNMDGSEGASAHAARDFAERIARAAKLPVTTWDERLTSRQAERLLRDADLSARKRKKRIDSLAAQIMLQALLDSRNAGNPSSPS
jgi:putative Holliday junction resolvase